MRKISKLVNGSEFVYKKAENAPRVALCYNLSLENPEKSEGIYMIMTQLFTQGTKNRSAEQIAKELDLYAIEFSADLKPDYVRFRFTCLEEDFDKALEISSDILKNTTFEDFDKEIAKTKGEITAKLDSPRLNITDKFYSTMFENHHYGHTSSKVLKNLDNLKKEDIIEAWSEIKKMSKKVCSYVGSQDFESVKGKLDHALKDFEPSNISNVKFNPPHLSDKKTVEIIKEDANQAHILKGWITESYDSGDYPALLLLNVILGSSGLSSRLFLELREKKGLAYVVRSVYESNLLCGDFYIYIATEPKNIEVSLNGFEAEIQKIISIPPSSDELENAKNNLFGKWAFSEETTTNQAIILAHYGIMGLGFNFKDVLREKIKEVTPRDINSCAKKYFESDSVTAILKP